MASRLFIPSLFLAGGLVDATRGRSGKTELAVDGDPRCEFVVEPTTPYFWDPTCGYFSDSLGCNADGKNMECRFCQKPPYQSIPCLLEPPQARAPTETSTSLTTSEQPTPVVTTAQVRGGLAELAVGRGCEFVVEPTTPYYWEPTCGSAVSLGCFADGKNMECRFCQKPPYQSIPCLSEPPEARQAPTLTTSEQPAPVVTTAGGDATSAAALGTTAGTTAESKTTARASTSEPVVTTAGATTAGVTTAGTTAETTTTASTSTASTSTASTSTASTSTASTSTASTSTTRTTTKETRPTTTSSTKRTTTVSTMKGAPRPHAKCTGQCGAPLFEGGAAEPQHVCGQCSVIDRRWFELIRGTLCQTALPGSTLVYTSWNYNTCCIRHWCT